MFCLPKFKKIVIKISTKTYCKSINIVTEITKFKVAVLA